MIELAGTIVAFIILAPIAVLLCIVAYLLLAGALTATVCAVCWPFEAFASAAKRHPTATWGAALWACMLAVMWVATA